MRPHQLAKRVLDKARSALRAVGTGHIPPLESHGTSAPRIWAAGVGVEGLGPAAALMVRAGLIAIRSLPWGARPR